MAFRTRIAVAFGGMLALAAVFLGAPAAHAASGSMWFDVQAGRCLDSNASGSIYTNPCQRANGYPAPGVCLKRERRDGGAFTLLPRFSLAR